MGGYTKNIAVIKGVAGGFSADGGALSGLVKAEKYGSFFRAEISLINFAPLESGRYVAAVSDGERTVAFDVPRFEGDVFAHPYAVDAHIPRAEQAAEGKRALRIVFIGEIS